MTDKQSILIAGDSWAAGVGIDSDDSLAHMKYGGITELLSNRGYQIRNLAKPGGSNLQSCDALKNYLFFNEHEIPQIQCVFFWQTEFFREIWYYRSAELKKEFEVGYALLKDHWIYRPYHRLAEISQLWNIPIYIIGGCSDTVWYDDFEKDFPGLKIICQSATNYIINSSHRIPDPVFCQFITRGWSDEFVALVKKDISNKDLELLLHDMTLGKNRIKQLDGNKQFFYPDGIHPNAHAQRLLFDLILKEIPDL